MMSSAPWFSCFAGLTLALTGTARASGPTEAPASTHEILLTSEGGARGALLDNVPFETRAVRGTVITVFPDRPKQRIEGIGSSFTESSAFVLAHLDPARRREVMEKIYGEAGANFSLARTHIGSCDFSVEGKYSYADEADDADLSSFSIEDDLAGFDPARYPGVVDSTYDLLPMIREALAIKAAQVSSDLRIIASAWTAPAWMKDTERWFIPGSPENDWQGDGGRLKPQYVATYADYLVRYLDAYARAGVELWGLTPVNEPQGNGGNWESMHFTPDTQAEFVRSHLGPRLHASPYAETRLFVYDQNRDHLEHWTDVLFGDPRTARYVTGVAVHWYSSTVEVYEDVFDRVHAKFPEFSIVHTEGCIDDLGKKAPGGIVDTERFEESGWFENDAFWWNANATDWAYTATWAGVVVEDHPLYTPVHRYARDIIVGLDHWVSGWIDWNVVLDRNGGPNHVGNFCGAPIMIDTEAQRVYYTPLYHVLAQFSRTIRPGDRALWTEQVRDGLGEDDLRACATINDAGLVSVQLLNTTKQELEFDLQIVGRVARITVPANAVQTVRVQI